MKVVLCEVGKQARITEIESKLEDMQQAVGGSIQAIYPFPDPVTLVCHEEGKLLNLPLNRALFEYDTDPENHSVEIVDIIAGDFFICGMGEEIFDSLSDELTEKFEQRFRYPEEFFMADNGPCVRRYNGK